MKNEKMLPKHTFTKYLRISMMKKNLNFQKSVNQDLSSFTLYPTNHNSILHTRQFTVWKNENFKYSHTWKKIS